MDMGTGLVGTDLFGTWIKSQSQISLSIYYSKSGHREDPEGGFTNPCKVVAMLGRSCVCVEVRKSQEEVSECLLVIGLDICSTKCFCFPLPQFCVSHRNSSLESFNR